MTKDEFDAKIDSLTQRAASRIADARRLQSAITDAGVREYLETAIRDFNDVPVPARLIQHDTLPALAVLVLEMSTFHFEHGDRKLGLIEDYVRQAGHDITMIG